MKSQKQRLSIAHPIRYAVQMGLLLGVIFSAATQIHNIVSYPLSQPWYLVQSFFLLAGMMIFMLIIRHRCSKVQWQYKTYFFYSVILGIMVSVIYLIYLYCYTAFLDSNMSARCSHTLLTKSSFLAPSAEELAASIRSETIALSGGLLSLLWTMLCSAVNALFLLYIRRR